jgi:hypothetical protein
MMVQLHAGPILAKMVCEHAAYNFADLLLVFKQDTVVKLLRGTPPNKLYLLEMTRICPVLPCNR